MILYGHKNIVKGYKKSILYNSEFTAYREYNEKENFDSYDFLKGYGMEVMPADPVTWESPSVITNAIISISYKNELTDKVKFNSLLLSLEKFICKHIVLYFSEFIPLKTIKECVAQIQGYNIQSVILLCEYHEDYHSDSFGEIVMNIPINKKLIVVNAPFEKNYEDTMFFTNKAKLFNTAKREDEFNPNNFLFNEALSRNVYFNRKLFIGHNGEIKNAPECNDVFGYIQKINNTEELREIIDLVAFQKFWKVHKDSCEVCKDCEFRYMCVDNRIPHKKNKDDWYYKEACEYDPYTGEWNNHQPDL